MLVRTETWRGLSAMKCARCRSSLNELVAIWSMLTEKTTLSAS